MRNRIVIGTRGSALARTQTKHVQNLLHALAPGLEIAVEQITTTGDRIRDVPLARIGGKGLFTKELEVAMLERRIDLAVHSLKDLPTTLPDGLCLGAVPRRESPYDALVSRYAPNLDGLPVRARVGTSSLRRAVQLRAYRPDLEIVDLRGNVPTRLRKLDEGELDAIVLAMAGLRRLGLEGSATEELREEVMVPAVGQGALGIECRTDDAEVIALLRGIHDAAAHAEVTAERALLRGLGGGCQVPLGALARVEGAMLHLVACVCSPDGATVLRHVARGPLEEAAALGARAAAELLERGAADMLEQASSSAGGSSPLAGRRIVVTRPESQASNMARELTQRGAEVFEFPTVQIQIPEEVDDILPGGTYDWLVFTSANGVSSFCRVLEGDARDIAEFAHCTVCAVGPATAEIAAAHGFEIDLLPEYYSGEGVFKAIRDFGGIVEDKRFLLPRGNLATRELPEALRLRGAIVDEVIVYETVPADVPRETIMAMLAFEPDLVTFTSPSTVQNFCRVLAPDQLEHVKARSRFASIGPVTTDAARALGLEIAIQPAQHDMPGLVQAIVEAV